MSVLQSEKATRKANGKDAILDAAEDMFSRHGYHGVSLRDISKLAGVELCLVSYHFKTKDELFRQVVERRAEDMKLFELARLDKALATKDGRLPRVEDLLTSYVRARFDMMFAKGEEWARYSRLSHHFLALEDRGRLIGLYRQASLASCDAYVEALCSCLASADPHRVRAIFDMLRVTVSAIAADTENLLIHAPTKANRDAALARIVAAYSAGLRDLL
jgi:AcrR family transcriptional regulator